MHLMSLRKKQRKREVIDYQQLWNIVYSCNIGECSSDLGLSSKDDVTALLEAYEGGPDNLLAVILKRSPPEMAFKSITAMLYTKRRALRYVYAFMKGRITLNGRRIGSLPELLTLLSQTSRHSIVAWSHGVYPESVLHLETRKV